MAEVAEAIMDAAQNVTEPWEPTALNPVYGPFFGCIGAASAMALSALGAAYGTAKSGTGIAAMAVMRPDLIMKSIIPVVS